MTIPTEKDFSELIDIFERISNEYLLPENIRDKYFPNETDCHEFLNKLYDSWERQARSWEQLAANVWLENQPNYKYGNEAVFGKKPELEPRNLRLKNTTQWLLDSCKPLSDSDYEKMKACRLKEREDYISEHMEQQKMEQSEPVIDPRFYETYETEAEIQESVEYIIRIPSKKERNSEEYCLRVFRSCLYRLLIPNDSFEWSIFFARALKDYFYKEVDIDEYTQKQYQEDAEHLTSVSNGAKLLIGHLEKEECDILGWRGLEDREIGPIIGNERKLIRKIEFVLMDIDESLELDNDRLNCPPIIRRKDKTFRERILVRKLWTKFNLYDLGRNVKAISYFLCLEGIKNNLEPRTISRMIKEWSNNAKDSYLHRLLK